MTRSHLPKRPACAVGWLLAALVSFSFLARAQNATNSFWQTQSIYQVITDRFFDGDASNNNADGNYNPSGNTSVHGGDFKGLEQKLDYIKALGATAIWISPIVLNANGEFHGYAGRDFYKVDPHWGTLADLQHFTAAAHARGLLVIDDIICNHGGDLINSADAGFPAYIAPPGGYTLKYRGSKQYAAPFNTNALAPAFTNIFHNNGAIPDYNTPEHYQVGELSGLDDFRTESDYVRSNMAAVYQYWIQQAGFDGFRIDTTKHIEYGFWQDWCPAIHAFAATNCAKPNFFMFGEVYDGSDALNGSYTGTMGGGAYKQDSILDYPLYFTINSVFATATGDTRQIENHYNAIAANYDTNAQMRLVTFLDNHDQPRFLSASGATTNRLQVALTFLYTSRGIPCLYYGTEQGFNGATDPYDREDMFAGPFKDAGLAGVDSFNMTHPLFLFTAQLNNFRRLYPALQLGTHLNRWNDPDSPGLFAYARRLTTDAGTQEVFVVFNTSASAQTLTNRSMALPAGTVMVNLFNTNETLTLLAGPVTPQITVPSMTAKIFVAQSDWKPLDPVVTNCIPAHDATNVAINLPVVLRFSKPMDTNSVQGAFSTSPSVGGTFSWSAARDVMTFTPSGSGFSPLTTVVVRLTNSCVDAVSGNALYAPYLMQYHTGLLVSDTTPPSLTLVAPTNNAVISGNLQISGTANDNLSLQKVEARMDNGPWLTAAGTFSWNLNLNSSNFLNGPHVVTARATDAAGNISPTNTANVRFINVPVSYVQRISGGNPANVTDCNANVWLRDTNYTFGSFGFLGGTNGYVANTISGICVQAQPLYQREHYSTNGAGALYQFDCPVGVYEITMLETETYWNAVGKRVFNAFIQGRQVLTNLDIYATAGGMNLPVTFMFTNAVTNSQLQVLFTPVVDNARISGLQVRKIADVYSDTDRIPDWWRLAYFGHPLGSVNDSSRATDDADGDGVSNLTEFFAGTDPGKAASVPAPPAFNITKILTTLTNVVLNATTTTNWSYQLQFRTGLGDVSVWTDIGPEVPGTGGVILLGDTGSATNVTRFYRVRAR